MYIHNIYVSIIAYILQYDNDIVYYNELMPTLNFIIRKNQSSL